MKWRKIKRDKDGKRVWPKRGWVTTGRRGHWLWRLVGRPLSFASTSLWTHSGGNFSPITHEYAVRSGHPITRTMSAADHFRISVGKSMTKSTQKTAPSARKGLQATAPGAV